MGEVLFIVILLIGLVGWTLLLSKKARVFWFITMAIEALVVAGAEITAKIMHDVTISQMYWRWSVNHVWQSWLAMGLFLTGMIVLAIHLQIKVIAGKGYKDGKEI